MSNHGTEETSMRRKLLCAILCTLLIAIAALPVIGGTDVEKEPTPVLSVVDQQQTNTAEVHWLDYGVANWQQFVNHGYVIEEVDCHIGCYYSGSADITLSIEKTLGSALTYVTYPATALPDNTQAWFTFDFPDVNLTYGEMYYIVIRFGIGSEYGWSGAYGDPYPPGESSRSPQWDYAFKTIVNRLVSADMEGEVSGGFGVNVWLKNLDYEYPIEIPIDLIINIDAPIMLIGSHSVLPLPMPIGPGEEVSVSTGLILGLGMGTVSVNVDLFSDGVVDKTVQVDALIFLPFVLCGVTPIHLP